MIKRVYAPDTEQVAKDYAGTSVAPDWLDFQNFAEWFYEQPFCKERGYQLDKDLILPGNKVYQGTLCSLIPRELNSFISADNRRNKHGCGVGFVGLTGRFFATIALRGCKEYLGTFDTKEEATLAYRRARPIYMNRLVDLLITEGKITEQQAAIARRNYGTIE